MMVNQSGTPGDDAVTGGADRDEDQLLPGLTVQRQPLDFTMQSLLTGTLEIDHLTNCLVVRMGDTVIDVAWPLGWNATIRNGEIALIDASGQLVGRLGDELRLEGGSVDATQAKVVSCTGRKQVFVASGRSSP